MKKNNVITAQNPEALLHDLRALVAEAEKVMAGSTAESGDLVESLQNRLEAARERVGELYTTTKKRITAGAKCTDEAIRENPYQSMAVALGVGVLLGVFIGRRP